MRPRLKRGLPDREGHQPGNALVLAGVLFEPPSGPVIAALGHLIEAAPREVEGVIEEARANLSYSARRAA